MKALGFQVGLHTGGAWPRRLATLLDARTAPGNGHACGATIDPRGARHRAGASPAPTTDSGVNDEFRRGGPCGRPTAGHSPANEPLAQPCDSLIDWVGLDVKHLPHKYRQVTGAPAANHGHAFNNWRLADHLTAAGHQPTRVRAA